MDKWTRERPAAPGFYWLRQGWRVQIVEIKGSYVCLPTPDLPVPLGAKGLENAEWSGPVSTPKDKGEP